MLPLFGEIETRSESVPTKREPIAAPVTRQKQTEPPSLFGNVDTISQQSEKSPAEEAAASVPISNISVSTDLASLDFLSESPQYIKGIGPRRAAMLTEELSIQTVGELLAYYPRDYIDRSKMVEIYRVGRAEDDEPRDNPRKSRQSHFITDSQRKTHR